VEWQRQNEASVHRTAKEFADDRKRVSMLQHRKDKPAEYLENAAVCAVANLCQSILTIEFLKDERSEGRYVSNQLVSVCNIVLCQHLGMAPEEGAYS